MKLICSKCRQQNHGEKTVIYVNYGKRKDHLQVRKPRIIN